MSYEIVYDRRFIRCGNKYIPFCLSGSSNCTQVNPATGKEILERDWQPFIYCDDMLLASAKELMEIVRKHHSGGREENFKFRGKWLDDEQVIRFFEGGIRDAVTVEEIVAQTRCTPECFLGAYVLDEVGRSLNGTDRFLHTTFTRRLEAYPKTSEELEKWILNAKAVKAAWLQSGETEGVYLCIGYFSQKPMEVSPTQSVHEPCIVKRKNSYVSYADQNCMRCTNSPSKAKLFEDSAEAYLYVQAYPYAGPVKIVKWSSISSRRKAEGDQQAKHYVISVQHKQIGRVYIYRKTRKFLHYCYDARYAKAFASEAAAQRWYKEKCENRFDNISDPKVSVIQCNNKEEP